MTEKNLDDAILVSLTIVAVMITCWLVDMDNSLTKLEAHYEEQEKTDE